MTSEEIQALFWKHVETVTSLDEARADPPELEPELYKLLCLVKNHPQHTAVLKQLFIEAGTTAKFSAWVVLYCMRDLRWPEVREAIADWFSALGGRYSVPRLMSYVSDVHLTYEDSPWDSADYFQYHWRREHPGEPWPCAGMSYIELDEL